MNSSNKQELQILVEESQKGNKNAFKEIFEDLNDRLFAYAVSHTSNREDAKDIIQETFIDLWNSIRKMQYRSEEEFYGFVFIITKRKIYKHNKTKKNILPFDEKIINENYEMKNEDYRHLFKNIDNLGSKYQNILKLRYWSDLTFVQIAKVLNIKETSAKVLHHRAIKKLQDNLKEYKYEF